MLLETLRILLVGALLVALPGYLLVQALFPSSRSRLRTAERVYLSLACGIALVALVGVTLGFLPYEKVGHLSTSATGSPNAEIALFVLSGLFFYVGLARGAYPRLTERFPALSLQ